MKNNSRKEIIISTLVCLLPILAGFVLYGRLPETVATHFGADGEANGWSSRAFTVFGLPALMAGVNLLVLFALNTDPKKKKLYRVQRRFPYSAERHGLNWKLLRFWTRPQIVP